MMLKSRVFRSFLKEDMEKLYGNSSYIDLRENLTSLRKSIGSNINTQLNNIEFSKGLSNNQAYTLNEAYQNNEAFVYMLGEAMNRPEYQGDTLENKMKMSGPASLKHYQKARSRIIDALRTDAPVLSRENTIYRFINRWKRDVDMSIDNEKDFEIDKYKQKNLNKYLQMWSLSGFGTAQKKKSVVSKKESKNPHGAMPKGYEHLVKTS